MLKGKLDKAREVPEPQPLQEQPKTGWYEGVVRDEKTIIHVTLVDPVRYFWEIKRGDGVRTGNDYVNTWPMRLKSWKMKEIDEPKEEVK